MNDSKDLLKKLPPMDLTFQIQVEGNVTRKQYEGEFSFLIPTGKTRARIDLKRAELNGGMKEEAISRDVADFHYMIAYLRHTLTEMPDWWKKAEYGYDLYDTNVAQAVHQRCLEFEANWLEQVWGKPEEAKSDEPKQ